MESERGKARVRLAMSFDVDLLRIFRHVKYASSQEEVTDVEEEEEEEEQESKTDETSEEVNLPGNGVTRFIESAERKLRRAMQSVWYMWLKVAAFMVSRIVEVFMASVNLFGLGWVGFRRWLRFGLRWRRGVG